MEYVSGIVFMHEFVFMYKKMSYFYMTGLLPANTIHEKTNG